jgi:hypothetical protein
MFLSEIALERKRNYAFTVLTREKWDGKTAAPTQHATQEVNTSELVKNYSRAPSYPES